MTDETVPHRKRLRAEGYDYAQPGWYFVTICIHHRVCLFGHIEHGTMRQNAAGNMISDVLTELSQHFENVKIDPFVVMPNHVHAIVIVASFNGYVSPYTLSDIVASFKLQTMNRYIQAIRELGWKPFPGRLWQRSFHDRIIHNDHQADRLYEYIEANPLLWERDTHYIPDNGPEL